MLPRMEFQFHIWPRIRDIYVKIGSTCLGALYMGPIVMYCLRLFMLFYKNYIIV